MKKFNWRFLLTVGAVGVFVSALVGCMGVGESTSSATTSALQAGKHAGPGGTGVACGDDDKQGIDDEKDADETGELANDDKDDEDSTDVNGCDDDDKTHDDGDISGHDDDDDLDIGVSGGKDADDDKGPNDVGELKVVITAP